MYAITQSSYRSVSTGDALNAGESRVSVLPTELIERIDSDEAKSERSQRLRSTDWTQMPDAPLSAAQKSSMALYRQQLRDLPSVPGFPNVPWPEFPSLGSAADGNIKAPI